MRTGCIVGVLALATGVSAHAQGVATFACAATPNGPVGYQITVNFERSSVEFQGGRYAAQISEASITWQTPRNDTEVRPAIRFSLDRVSGQIRSSVDCQERDAYYGCNSAGILNYCRPGPRAP